MRLALLFSLLGVLVSGPVAVQAERLRLATSVWAPYVDGNLPGSGLAVDLVTNALERAGYEYSLSIGSWPRTLEGAKIGVYDVIPAAWYTEERAADLLFSRPYLTNRLKFIKRRGDAIVFSEPSDLKGRTIGVVAGYAYGPRFEQLRGVRKWENNHVIQSLLRLVNGQVDLALGDEWVLRHEIAQYLRNSAEGLEILPQPLEVRDLHLAVSRQHPRHEAIVQAFDAAMEAMRKDGTYERIIDRHLGQYPSL